MVDADNGAHESSPGPISSRDKRPVSLWVVTVYLLLAGLVALVVSLQAPSFMRLAKTLDVTSALLQIGSGLLLLFGLNIGRRLYLFAVPVIILVRALYLGSVMGFTDDDFPINALSPFLIYGVVTFFLMRGSVKNWLARSTRMRGNT